jgi:hypothetical protein
MDTQINRKGMLGFLRYTRRLETVSSFIAGRAAVAIGMLLCVPVGCGNPPVTQPNDTLQATLGPRGGELVGAKGSALEGVKLTIPAGALASDTRIEIKLAIDDASLPPTAVRCGPQVEIGPAGTQLAVAAQVTLPFDENIVAANERFDDEVKVWVREGDHWGQKDQVNSVPGSVTIELSTLDTVAAGVNPHAPTDEIQFDLNPNARFLNCFAQFPGDANRAPSVHVTVVRGELNDALTLRGQNFKPGLKFDLFTVQHSNLLSNGRPDPGFLNFGLAWYQSDLQANHEGQMRAVVRTILLDQIFGFDPAVSLAPTNAFHVGFWFNNPQDAAACGFNPSQPTPFNGEHRAGPVAMISVPDARTGLGPLCTHADTSVSPPRCSP